ncbi:MAG: bifunctional transcriptional activator/DNA repair enzyme AdaA [Gemmatimonadota bacterium]
MDRRSLPPDDEMYEAMLARDTRFDGIFITAVTTTGIFCRPSCPAKKPNRENVEFYRSAREALASGYRPCQRCRPLELPGRTPEFARELLEEIDRDPMVRLKDRDLRARGLDPATVRRWFKKHHGMTFHAYQRARRLGRALGQLARGEEISRAAFGNGYESLSGFQEALRQLTGRSATRSRDATIVHLTRVVTPLGPMLLGASDDGVCLLEFTDRRMLETQLGRVVERLDCVFVPGWNDVGRQLRRELKDYFAGDLRNFTLPLVTPGTAFQKSVWTAIRKIPHGDTRSYSDLAATIDRPGAARAVARASGDNRIAIVIPCHRIVGADGSLTGYGGGVWRKRWLLHNEGVALPTIEP